MELSKRLKVLRKEAGLSQEGLARRADISLNVMNRIETGAVTDPHFSTLVGISGALGLTVGELLGEGSLTPGGGPGNGGLRSLQALVHHVENVAADQESWIENKMAAPPSGPGARFAWQAQVFGWVQAAYPVVLRLFEVVAEQHLMNHPLLVDGLDRLDQVSESMDTWLSDFEEEVAASKTGPEPEALDELARMRARRLLLREAS
jgi:transcriptional regulator with XRE-family HTH domain